jgi:hypothetical protein
MSVTLTASSETFLPTRKQYLESLSVHQRSRTLRLPLDLELEFALERSVQMKATAVQTWRSEPELSQAVVERAALRQARVFRRIEESVPPEDQKPGSQSTLPQ